MSAQTLDATFGAAFIGLMASAVLYGLTLLQTYTYYRGYPRDSWGLKGLVGCLWFLDTGHLALCTTTIYWYLVTHNNHPDQLDITHWSMNIQTDFNGAIGLIVELFFAHRVWKISKNWILTGVISVLACLHFTLGVYFTVQAFVLKRYSRYSELTWVTVAGLGGAAAADILIAASMVYFLSRSRTGFEKTDSLIGTLIVYAINTGLLTSICATAAVIAFAAAPSNFIWISFFWCLGKLYINSLLATLNSRLLLREKARGHHVDGTFVQLSHIRGDGGVPSSPTWRRYSGAPGERRQLSIKVETIKEQRSDYYEPPNRGDEPSSKGSSSRSLTISPPLFSGDVSVEKSITQV